MPVYDYKCPDHGVFHELASMDDHAKPSLCPQCQTLAPRVIMFSPAFLDMPADKRKAEAANDKSRPEPNVSTIDSRAENAEKLKHGCGCTHHKRPSKLMYTAEGNKMFPSARPWMISH